MRKKKESNIKYSKKIVFSQLENFKQIIIVNSWLH